MFFKKLVVKELKQRADIFSYHCSVLYCIYFKSVFYLKEKKNNILLLQCVHNSL